MFVHSKKFAIFAFNKQLAAFSTKVNQIPGSELFFFRKQKNKKNEEKKKIKKIKKW